MLDIYMFLLL